MTERIIIAGAGGQGVMLLGKILAAAAMREDKFVTWFPSYGAEVRGGAAYCMVVISGKEIGSPYIEKADTLIALNGISWEKFKGRAAGKCLCLLNSSLAKQKTGKQKALKYPFTAIAVNLGNIKVANMIALGCLIKHKEVVKPESVLMVIKEMAPQDKKGLVEINQNAFNEGVSLK